MRTPRQPAPAPASRSAAGPAPAQRAARPNRTGLPDHLKAGAESLSGGSLDHVRVHRNSAQPAQLNAHAFAQGGDIHLAPGQEKHLPHEAWHAVQQAEGRVPPTAQLQRVALNDDPALEREADAMGVRAGAAGAAAGPAAALAPAPVGADAPAQLKGGRPGGNPAGRGGKGKYQPGPKDGGGRGRGFDRAGGEAARRRQQGKYEAKQAALRARLEQRQARQAQQHENLLHRVDAAGRPHPQPPVAEEPAHEAPEDDLQADAAREKLAAELAQAETVLQGARDDLLVLGRAIRANAHAINEYRHRGAPYALEFIEQANALADRATGLLELPVFPSVKERNALYAGIRSLVQRLEEMIGKGRVKELLADRKIKETADAADEKKAGLLRRTKKEQSEAAANAAAKPRADATAYLAEMTAKYRQYANDRTGTVNRGAYYQNPNGAPPAAKVRIGATAMAIVEHLAEKQGWSLRDSRTTDVSFHKDRAGKLPFIFHI